MNNMKMSDKKENFKKRIMIVGAAAVMATAGVSIANSDYNLSKFDVDNDKYIDYIDGSENKKMERMINLDEQISRYEELSTKMFPSKEEKTEMDKIESYLEKEMTSGYLGDFYLKDILKEKIKEAYDKESKNKIQKIETKWDIDAISIKMYDKYGRVTFMSEKDKVAPIRSAMDDIATLQEYENKDEFSKSEINNFIKIHKNMKGFSNIKFIKTEGKPLSYVQIDLGKEYEQER